jgi:hypothetical protein
MRTPQSPAVAGFPGVIASVVTLVLSGCASVVQPACPVGSTHMVNDALYFGTSTPGGFVSAERWADFLRLTVTPRFPNGFTVLQGSGQWKAADGLLNREASYLLNVLHVDDARAENAIREIVADYKSGHQQESVLRAKSFACVSY